MRECRCICQYKCKNKCKYKCKCKYIQKYSQMQECTFTNALSQMFACCRIYKCLQICTHDSIICANLEALLQNSFDGCLRQSWQRRQTRAQLRRRFYVGKILRKAMLGFLEKLSKWFHGPADLAEPSGPEQTGSYNASIDQFLDSKNYLLYLLGR